MRVLNGAGGRSTSVLLTCALALSAVVFGAAPVRASHTSQPSSVTVPGSFQSELGCPGDWQPECASTGLALEDGVWQGTFDVPAGNWEYKAALNGNWSENYGANAAPNGGNLFLNLSEPAPVKFYYSHETHWITSNRNARIVTAPGSYQSEIGCPGDWDPTCLHSWLQDPDGDGVYTMTAVIPAGDYFVKAAIDESWNENYGQNGAQNGPDIPFTVASGCTRMLFSFNSATNTLTVTPASAPPQPAAVTVAGSLQSELGCLGDWQPDCAATHLTLEDGVWQGTFDVPAGNWEYKAPINNSWDENYGANATLNGSNIPLNLSEPAAVKFYYSHQTHWITSNRNARIVTAPGSYQSEIGCPGDWDPSCLRSWLQDPDGDGIYTFTTTGIPAGDYEVKATIDESWNENYGAGGAQNGPNIPFTVPSSCAEVTFVFNSSTNLLSVNIGGAPRGNLGRAQAHWVSTDTIAWSLPGFEPDWSVTLHYSPTASLGLTPAGVEGGVEIPLAHDPAGLSDEIKAKFPHLASLGAFKVPADRLGEVAEALRSQQAVSAADGSTPVDATALQLQGAIDDLYDYDGPLGPTFAGGATSLRVWAPTARSVKLHLFDGPTSPDATVVNMTRDDATGVWSATGDASWKGKYYLYEVEVFTRATRRVERNLVTDPYSVSVSTNSRRSQVIDLADAAVKPAGWDAIAKPRLDAPEDIVLYELHVRDFSASDETVPAALRGTYKAFTLTGSSGMRHLAELASAGLTHVHLLPAFDIASVNEDRSTWQEPAGDLSTFAPDSEEQQARVGAVANSDGFNWGYDPIHYTVPEGSYATDPNGTARVREFREMVQGLNAVGLRVVMDVVYNHTTASGQDANSVLDRVVPGYYHRLDAEGEVESSTCCENTASEFEMMEKLLVDSVVTWAKAYKVDGFRFDLMGHHMKRNMVKLRAALDALTLDEDGVDGSKIYLYGEGWNFGEVANNARGENAVQLNMAGTGIGTFSDRTRDAVRGGGPFSGIQEQGYATGLVFDPNGTNQGSASELDARLLAGTDWIRVGLAGNLAGYPIRDRFGNETTGAGVMYNGQPAGYTADPQELIAYIDAHDNETFFDALQLKAPVSLSMAERLRLQSLGFSVVTLGQGVPFVHAGAELLRSKSLDRNSYNSGDWFNTLDFTYETNNWGVGLPPAGDNGTHWPVMAPLLANPSLRPTGADIVTAFDRFKELLEIRKSSPLFRLRTATEINSRLRFYNTGPDQVRGLIVMGLADADGRVDRQYKRIVTLFNSANVARTFTAPELAGGAFVLHPTQAFSVDPLARTAAFASGAFTVPARTASVFVELRPAGERIGLLVSDVAALRASGTINGGQANALTAKLRAAQSALARGNVAAAANQMRDFVDQVESFVATGVLTEAEADPLVAEANAIIAMIGSD